MITLKLNFVQTTPLTWHASLPVDGTPVAVIDYDPVDKVYGALNGSYRLVATGNTLEEVKADLERHTEEHGVIG